MLKNQSLKFKLIVFTLPPVAIISFLIIYFIISKASSIVENQATNLAFESAYKYANEIDAKLEIGMDAARTLAEAFSSYEEIPLDKRREVLNSMLKNTLE